MPNTIQVKDASGSTVSIGCYTSAGQTTMANSVPVAIASDNVLTLAANTDTIATGNIAALNGSVQINTQAVYTATVQVLGTWVGTLTFQMSIDGGTNWTSVFGFPVAGGTGVSSTTTNGVWTFATGGYALFRVTATAYTSGTAAVTIDASIAQNQIGAHVYGISPVGVAPTYAPVAVSGVDGGGLKRSLLTDTDGTQQSNVTKVAGTAVATGNGTATAGTQRVAIATDSVPAPVTDVQIPSASAQPVRLVGQRTWQAPFTDVSASTLSSTAFTQIYKSAGITLSQASGALAVVASTTANEEWLAVSTRSWTGALSMRQKTILSQRIANNNFWVILGDKIGDGLTLTVNSSTSVTVSSVPGSWSSANVGQSMFMGAVGGLAGMTPGRFAIASVSGSNITFTVPAMGISTGTTTCSLFGWNHAKILYTSTTATNAAADTQYQGWASGDTTLTVNTTASPGHLTQILADGRDVYFDDALVASSATPSFTTRGSRYSLLPDETVPLFLYLWVQNGTTNPASTTTWTLQEISVENFPNNPVFIAGVKQSGLQAPLPITATNLSANIAQVGGTTTVTGGVAGIMAVGGNIAIGTARTSNPLVAGGVDINNLTRANLLSAQGLVGTMGAGESVNQFSVGTGAAAVTDGTNGKTFIIQPYESDVYLEISAISTSPTIQMEYSYDNTLWSIMPMQRVEATAASIQYGSAVGAFTPAAGQIYRGRTYGATFLRVHLTAGTTSNTIGIVRVVPVPGLTGATVSPFTLTQANTTEAVGSANGQVQVGGVRTLAVSGKGSTKAILYVDAASGTTGTNTIALEGAQSASQTTWDSISMQPLGGGATVTSASFTNAITAPGAGAWEADVSQYAFVRARATAVMTTTPVMHGALKLINVPTAIGLGNSRKPTYAITSSGLSHTGSTNLVVIESGASKQTTIKRVVMSGGTATAGLVGTLTVNRNTVTASASGTTPTAATMQRVTTDPAFSGIVRTGAFTLTSVTTTATQLILPVLTGTTTNPAPPLVYDFTNGGTEEGLVIPVGVTNGVMFTHSGGGTAATNESITVEWTEE